MEKMPNFNDVFLSIMASFIGFGLVIGIAQAAFDFGGGRSLLLSSPVFAEALDPADPGTASIMRGVTVCPEGKILKYSNNFVAGTGYCVKLETIATASTTVSDVCPAGYEKNSQIWTENIKKACALAAQKLKILDAQCMVALVEKRDNAILAGMDSSYNTQRNLVVTRERELKNAWLITDRKARRAEISRVWNKYRLDIKYMQRQSNTLRVGAWKQFNLDRRACGTYATSDDYTNAGVDASLQLFPATL